MAISLVFLFLSQSVLCREELPSKTSELSSLFGLNVDLMEDLLKIQFTPKENSVEIRAKLDLGYYKGANKSWIKGGESSGESNTELSPQKITLGFDSGGFVDVVVLSLLPFEESESEDGSVIDMELGQITMTDHIQDFHWSKKDGILVPDTIQSYDLVAFDVGNNGSVLSVTISRPWLTCDPHDVQFTMEPVEIWWVLEMSDSERIKSSNLEQLENLEEENSTMTAEEEIVPKEQVEAMDIEKLEPPTTVRTSTERTSTAKSLIEANVTVHGREVLEEKEAEVLKSIKDHDFHGPVVLSMEKLLQNFTRVRIKGCDALKTDTQVYNCSLENYRRRDAKMRPRYFIAAAASSHLKRSAKNSGEKGVEPCPYFIDEGRGTTLVKALTGGDKMSGSRKKGNGGRESRNSAFHMESPLRNFILSFTLLMKTIYI